MAQEVVLQASSRYALTDVFAQNGRTFFGVTSFPPVRIDGDEPIVAVTGGKSGTLMHISYNHYGVVDYWWAIARANQVMNPVEGLPIGTALRIPKIEHIRSALGGGGYA